jgi:uncharacterized protein YjiS (DUF1127 family)
MRILHCCGASLLLFKRRNIPILRVNRVTGEHAGLKRKRIVMFANLVRFVREWKRYNRSMSELSRLGDRELADIGISRSDIQRVAWNAAHQR